MAVSSEEQETGESPTSFAAAADDAARKLGVRLGDEHVGGPWSAGDFEVELGHHSPSHIEVYRVTLKRP
jgi:hypothetical protein